MPTKNPLHVQRGTLGAAKRWHPEQVPERKRDLEVSKLAAHIDAVVAAAPAPTPEQLNELARLLLPSLTLQSGRDAA
jgi:hypothetical protein